MGGGRSLAGLAGIREESGVLVIGAMTTHWQMESSTLLRARCPVLAHPAADQPATMIAVGAELVCEGPRGRRAVKAGDWFQGS